MHIHHAHSPTQPIQSENHDKGCFRTGLCDLDVPQALSEIREPRVHRQHTLQPAAASTTNMSSDWQPATDTISSSIRVARSLVLTWKVPWLSVSGAAYVTPHSTAADCSATIRRERRIKSGPAEESGQASKTHRGQSAELQIVYRRPHCTAHNTKATDESSDWCW